MSSEWVDLTRWLGFVENEAVVLLGVKLLDTLTEVFPWGIRNVPFIILFYSTFTQHNKKCQKSLIQYLNWTLRYDVVPAIAQLKSNSLQNKKVSSPAFSIQTFWAIDDRYWSLFPVQLELAIEVSLNCCTKSWIQWYFQNAQI